MAKRELQAGKLPGMTKDEFTSAVLALRDDARDWIDTDVAPARARSWKYYNGAVDKATDVGRSKAVLTEVRDAVESVVVSLLRIFLTTKTPVQFVPRGPEDVSLAAQQTDAVNHVFYNQNPGFRILSDAFRDALVAKLGALRVWWDETPSIEETTYEGIDEAEFAELAASSDTEVLEFSVDQEDLGDDPAPVEDRTLSVRVRRTRERGQVRVAAVPPEEIIFNKSATSAEDATIIGMDGKRKAQDVVAEGLATWSEIEGHFASITAQTTDEVQERSGFPAPSQEEEVDPANREVRVSELFVRLDKDGDGIPELRRVVVLGDGGEAAELVSDEVWDKVNIFLGTPFSLPHNIIGLSIADLTVDLQDVGTSVQRAMMDSLYAAVNPRYTAVQNQVNIPDLARNRFNDIIRVRAPNAVQPLTIPFLGKEALPVLEYMDQRKEQRTGVSKASLGLDPDALQSSTELGVRSTVTAAQAKGESIARSLAEQMVGPAFQEINRLLTHYQDKPLMVRLRGKFIPISTDGFVTDMDVTTNVGLGRGTEDERLAALAQIVAKQELILSTIGPDNPIVTMAQYSTTLNELVDLSPLTDPSRYFNPPEQVAQEMEALKQRKANQPPPVSPADQAKIAKAQTDMQIAKEKAAQDAQIKEQEAEARIKLEERKIEGQLELKRAELLAEIELEKIKVQITPEGPQVGNIPGST